MPSEPDYNPLADSLRQLAATGSGGFEGLVQRLLERLTGIEFFLAHAGAQAGRDMTSARTGGTIIAVECKRYGKDRELDEDELKGKLISAVEAIPGLDLWVLAASRPVSDQVYNGLQSAAERLNVDVLALGFDGSQGGLTTLCATDPEIVSNGLHAAGVQTASNVRRLLEGVQRQPDFPQRRDALRTSLGNGAGAYAARLRLNADLAASFASARQSRASFGQPIDVDLQAERGLLVERRSALERLNDWFGTWHLHRSGVAVLGEEGDGKTWVVGAWVSERIKTTSSPIVLWIPSQDAVSNDIEELLTRSLRKRLGSTVDRWSDRLKRWVSSPGHREQPVLLLVLDGINERHRPQWWRSVVEGLLSEPWTDAVAALITTRTSYWREVADYSHITWPSIELSGYDDLELDSALKQRGLARASLQSEIMPLLRRPRYLDLAVQHRAAMAASGDITVPRLIYEDWRDRESRRAGLASEQEFQRVIMSLAEVQRERRRLDQADLSAATIGTEYADLLGELQTSGILVVEGRHWKVEPARLALGLGLLLVERLEDEGETRPPAEVLESWLEPAQEVELKTSIVEHAVIHALRSKACSASTRTLLISKWLSMRNRDANLGSVTAYFLLDPDAFLSAAETVWSDHTDDEWGEEALKAAFEQFASVPSVQSHLVAAFERWMGFVLDRGDMEGGDDSPPPLLSQLSAEVKSDFTAGTLEHAGMTLTIVSDPGLLRLTRLALAVISCTDRQPFAHSLATAFLSDALIERSSVDEVCQWVIRTSERELWPLLEPEARRLIEARSTAARQAAYRLLTSVGTAAALELRNSLGEDVFPQIASLDQYRRDPCTSGFAWRMDDCVRCAGNDEVPVRHMAQQLTKCLRDPEFVVPPNTVSRMVESASAVEVAKVWSSTWKSEHDLSFDVAEGVLAGCAPDAFGDLIRRLALEIPARQDLSLRQLAYQLRRFRLAFTATEIGAVRRVWETLRLTAGDDNRETTRAEHALFDLMLSGLSAHEQLDALLSRHPDALLYTSFADHFKPMAWDRVRSRLGVAANDRDVGCILAFVSSHPEAVPAEASTELVALLDRPDPLVRVLTLRLIYRAGIEAAGTAVAASSWRVSGLEGLAVQEDHWGSLVLARWGSSLPYDVLRQRIAPTYLGRAVAARGSVPEEVRRLGDDLDDAWLDCGSGSLTGYPTIEVSGRLKDSDELDLPSVPRTEFSRTISYQSRGSTWGGKRGEPAQKDVLPSDAEIEVLHTRLGEVLSEQRRARNHWFARRFSPAGLEQVVVSRPELVDRWMGGPEGLPAVGDRIWLARSFYEALCQVLLSVDPAKGTALYRHLRAQESPVRFIDGETGIPILEFALFRAPDCGEVRRLWEDHLDEAACDRDLLVIAALVGNGNASSWLRDTLENDLHSSTAFRKVRALRLQGFWNIPLTMGIGYSPSDVIEWQSEQQAAAEKDRRCDEWARRWFNRFMSASSDDAALGAFRMFLRSVDSRYVWWRENHAELSERRRCFLAASAYDIERAIKQNEETLRKHFLGMRVVERQAWPWL